MNFLKDFTNEAGGGEGGSLGRAFQRCGAMAVKALFLSCPCQMNITQCRDQEKALPPPPRPRIGKAWHPGSEGGGYFTRCLTIGGLQGGGRVKHLWHVGSRAHRKGSESHWDALASPGFLGKVGRATRRLPLAPPCRAPCNGQVFNGPQLLMADLSAQSGAMQGGWAAGKWLPLGDLYKGLAEICSERLSTKY